MARRTSVYVKEITHANPIPAASRVGNMVMSGIINGYEPGTHKLPATLEEQARNMFGHVKRIVEAAGGTTDDILKITVWMADRSQRDALNKEWVAMFPDEASRPARHTMQSALERGSLVQCDFVAVIGG